MNNTGCILTELAGPPCTPEQALQMPLAPELGENGFISSWDGVGWDRMNGCDQLKACGGRPLLWSGLY